MVSDDASTVNGLINGGICMGYGQYLLKTLISTNKVFGILNFRLGSSCGTVGKS